MSRLSIIIIAIVAILGILGILFSSPRVSHAAEMRETEGAARVESTWVPGQQEEPAGIC